MNPATALLVALVSCALASCSRDAVPERVSRERASDTVLAVVGGERLTAAEFQAERSQRFRGVSSGATSAQNAALLEEMICTKAALARARAAGFDRDEQTRELIDKLIAARWLETEFARRTNSVAAVDDAEIAAWYQSNGGAFRVPPLVRAGVVTFRISSRAEPDRRAAWLRRAESVRSQAASLDDAAFAELVREQSEDQSTRYTGGDTGWLQEGDPAPRWQREVIHAAFALKQPGDVAPLITTTNACFVVRLTARRSASVRPLSEVREAIRYQLQRARQQQNEQAFFEELKRGLDVRINREVFKSLTVPATATTVSPPALPGG